MSQEPDKEQPLVAEQLATPEIQARQPANMVSRKVHEDLAGSVVAPSSAASQVIKHVTNALTIAGWAALAASAATATAFATGKADDVFRNAQGSADAIEEAIEQKYAEKYGMRVWGIEFEENHVKRIEKQNACEGRDGAYIQLPEQRNSNDDETKTKTDPKTGKTTASLQVGRDEICENINPNDVRDLYEAIRKIESRE